MKILIRYSFLFYILFFLSFSNLIAETDINNFQKNKKKVIIAEKELDRLIDAINLVKQNSLKNLTDEQIVDQMISGFLKEFDEYGGFFENEIKYKNFNERLQNSYNGVGIILEKNNKNEFYIEDLFFDSVAKKSGLLKGDVVNFINQKIPEKDGPVQCQIDENLILNITRFEVLQNERPSGGQKNFDIMLSCQNIKQKNLEFRMLENEIGFLKIYSFADKISNEIKDILNQNAVNLKGLIIDLRNNGGGLRDEVIELASFFLEKGKLISVIKDSQNNSSLKFESKPGNFLKNASHINLMIMVNKNSASASEIFAGALKDNARALIIGQKTYGKGVGQNVFSLPNGKFLKLTTSSVFTPSGHEIQGNGIIPNIEIDENFDLSVIDNNQKYINENFQNDNQINFLRNDLEVYITYKMLKIRNLR